MNPKSFVAELKRPNVYKVAIPISLGWLIEITAP
jgi:hypothetical protein